MKAVSNVVAALVLIGVTLAGFAIAYPIFFVKTHAVLGSSSLDEEAREKGVKLSLIDYDAVEAGSYYNIKLWIYNAGWSTAYIAKICTPNGYVYEESITIEPGGIKEIDVSIPRSYGRPDRIVVVTRTRVFIFDLK